MHTFLALQLHVKTLNQNAKLTYISNAAQVLELPVHYLINLLHKTIVLTH